ncbi:hypothetical protein [Streptomyces celluloflavus]|uniref:hypothetical protein n=1 Tax=Streptomyces celluloflavus TaxID=58344 RepID=UPI0036CF2096
MSLSRRPGSPAGTTRTDGTAPHPARPALGDIWSGRAWRPSFPRTLTALRLALATVYVWFGVLKLLGTSPAGVLVRAALPFPAPSWFVPALGGVEILIGTLFALNRYLPQLLPLFAAHMAGTFSLLVFAPHLAFQNADPLQLTATGEFVIKNLILLSAGALVSVAAGHTTATGAQAAPAALSPAPQPHAEPEPLAERRCSYGPTACPDCGAPAVERRRPAGPAGDADAGAWWCRGCGLRFAVHHHVQRMPGTGRTPPAAPARRRRLPGAHRAGEARWRPSPAEAEAEEG